MCGGRQDVERQAHTRAAMHHTVPELHTCVWGGHTGGQHTVPEAHTGAQQWGKGAGLFVCVCVCVCSVCVCACVRACVSVCETVSVCACRRKCVSSYACVCTKGAPPHLTRCLLSRSLRVSCLASGKWFTRCQTSRSLGGTLTWGGGEGAGGHSLGFRGSEALHASSSSNPNHPSLQALTPQPP